MPFLKSYRYLFFNKFSVLALFFILYSLYIYYVNESVYNLNFSFVLFAFVSYFFWTEIGVFLMLIPRKLSTFIIAILSFLWSFLILSAPHFFNEFKEFLSTGLVILLKEQPVYFWGYVRQVTSNPLQLTGIIGLGLLLFYLFYIRKMIPKSKRKIYVVGFTLIVFVANLQLNMQRRYFQHAYLPLDTHTFYAIKFGLKKHSDEKPLKHILNDNWDAHLSAPDEQWNIVLIVFESLSRVPLPYYGYDNNYMPFMSNWIQQEQNNFVLMKKGMSISGATDISMPSIYTGIGSEKNYFNLVKAPFLWDYAKKAGYSTTIINVQSQEWKGMKSFVNDKYLDNYFYPEKLNLSFINDIGADDLTVLKKLKTDIINLKNPFFIYYNNNATHGPIQDHSPQIKDFKGITDKYGKALFITDKTVEKITELVKKKNQWDRTIFIFTADHGYYIAKRRSRLSSFFKETLDIPIMFRFPKQWIDKYPEKYQNLIKNQHQRVCNLDLAPTIFEILFDKNPIQMHFTGKSLLHPVDDNRVIIALSTNETRHWNREGFGIYNKNDSYIYHDNTGFHYFNVYKDSMQQNDLIKSIPTNRKQFFDSIIQSNQYLLDVLKRTQSKPSS